MDRYLFGFHAIRSRMKSSPDSVETIWLRDDKKDKRTIELLREIKSKKIHLERVSAEGLSEVLDSADLSSNTHQGIVARVTPITLCKSIDELLAKIAMTTPESDTDELDDFDFSQDKKHAVTLLVLDGVTDPHNLGACLRVADAAGAMAVIAPIDHSAPITAIVSKVASGAAEHLPYIQVTNLARTLQQLKEAGFWIVGTDEQGEDSFFQIQFAPRTVFVLGAEGAGLRPLTKTVCDSLLRIPMMGSVESLNVSVASGVVLYERLRQLGKAVPD